MAVKTEFPLVILVLILTSLTQIRSETCTFTRSADTKGLGSGTYIGVKSLEECEQLCVEDSSCVAIYRDPPLCYFAVSTLTESKADATFSSKSCTADTTPEPTTTEPTTPEPTTTEPTTSGVCVMIRTEDTTGGNDVYYKLDFSPTSCLGLCQVVDDCQSVTIGRTSCQYYTDVTTPTTILGSIHYVKTQCNDGMKCCWETQTNSASDDTPTFEHDNTLDSCEALCGKLVTCSGVKWSNNECHVYVNHPGLTPESNSIFSKKACSTGGDKGSFKLSSTCSERNGGIQLKTNLLYFLSVLLFLFLFL